MSVNDITGILWYLESRWCSFILNCPPNTDGQLDTNIVNRLEDVGLVWSPDYSRPLLPPQQSQIEHPITPVSATATSGDAYNAIDGKNDRIGYTVWQSSSSLPQSITIDLGMEYSNVSILSCVPKYVTWNPPMEQGSIQSYRIYKSTNGTDFTEIASGTWNGDTDMKVATFLPTNARYIRLEALSAVEGFAAATEIAIGTWVYGDFTGNNIVNMDDLPEFFDFWLVDDCNEITGLDLNDDCLINFSEFSLLAQNWLEEN